MKCTTCESCEYAQYCGATEIMRKCDRHNNKAEQTNEEWFCGLSTEDKAKWLHTAIFDDNFANKMADEAYMNMQTRDDYIEMWLKQPHKEQK